MAIQCLRKKQWGKATEIKEQSDICNIWIIRHQKMGYFAIGKNHVTEYIKKKSDWFHRSNIMQESTLNIDTLTSSSRGHSRSVFAVQFENDKKNERSFFTLSYSLIDIKNTI